MLRPGCYGKEELGDAGSLVGEQLVCSPPLSFFFLSLCFFKKNLYLVILTDKK